MAEPAAPDPGTGLPAEARELFGGDPAGFVVARDALAKRLKSEGDVVAAAAVKRLRRPTAGAAAVNTLVREHPDALARVLAAGAELAAAQAAGNADAMRDAMRERRAAVAAAAALAPTSQREAVVASLDAAAVDAEAARAVQAGMLTRELDPVAGFLGAAPPPRPSRGEPEEPRPSVDRARREAQDRAAAARRKAEAARMRAEAAATEAEQLAEHASRLEAEADRLERAVGADS